MQNEKKYEALKLDNQLCFALYSCSKEVTRAYAPYLNKLGITYTQYITLLVLWEKDHLNVKELGEKLGLDSGTLTPLLKKLEALNVVKRNRDKSDERNVYVDLTQKGKEMKEEALAIPTKIFKSTGLTLDEVIDLKNKLIKLLNNLNHKEEKNK
jgi:DNA-binding MarR family transcriptional regulator